MNTILLTCSGGPAAVGVIKSLRDINFDGRVVSIDLDPLAVGGYMSDASYVVPRSDSDEYWDVVFDIIKQEGVDLILPTGDSDIRHFSQHRGILESMGVSVFMSDYDTILTCQDKMRFYKSCVSEFDEYLPKTTTNGYDLELPILAKPKSGSGSRGIHLCKSKRELDLITDDSYIFQEYLPGEEYTVDVLCDMDTNVLSVVPRKRVQVKAGISTKGEIVRDSHITELCTRISKHLNIKGPICIQLKGDSDGKLKFIEINPRLGGGTYFTTLAGVNFIDAILKLNQGNRVTLEEPNEIKVVRYFEEIIV